MRGLFRHEARQARQDLGHQALHARVGLGLGLAALDGAAKFVAWCLDIARALALPSSYAVTTDPFAADTLTGQQKGDIRKLFSTGYDAAMLGDNAFSAGFQIALWEIVNETSGSYDVTAGSFTVAKGKAAREAATGLLAGLGGPAINTGFRVI